MNYVDGYLIAVPAGNKQAYLDLARKSAAIFKELGAIRVTECWGDDVPDGKVTDFRKAVKAEDGEAVLFSWTEWPDKATRDRANKKMNDDPRLKELFSDMPFDGTRMIYGGFQQIMEV